MNKELSANTTLSHYRIVSKLGAGGMGEVWLAEDTRLGRKVALKLLPAEFTEDSERVRRFTLEAKAASALNHPNIIAVHDIGECETGRFIVMEFVAGRTLRSVIAKDNSLETFFTLGAQMAKALSAAHAAGITHRDIKPDNIMVRDDGYVKMLDFGLARLLPATASDPEAMTLAQQTTPGTVMGTLAYMSPEQASGQTVGSSSDVFALGIVLYELVTGTHPFKSETMIGYLHAITSQTPPTISSIKSHLPAALDDLILRMLEKDADLRPTASEVVRALQEIEKYGSSKTIPVRSAVEKTQLTKDKDEFRVAVLPFKYRGSNSDIDALADGISEEIVTGLSRFSWLSVISRSSTLRYASESSDVRTMGKNLGARFVMEGTLRVAGTKLRLSVQLVDASTGAHLWAENYEREFSPQNIFELQDDLVPRIVSTVADWYGVLTHSMSEAVRLKPIEQLTPYEAVLRSFGYYERVTPQEHAASRLALERAVEQAPGNADGWAMLSMMYGEEFRFGFNEQPDPMGRSLQAARRAVDVAPSNHFAHLALAQALFFRKEFDTFRHAAERAIALNPMDGSTMEYASHLIAFSGDWDHGCEVAERARQLNPNHPGWYWALPFYNAYRNGDYPIARAFALKIDQPTVDLCQVMLAAVYGQLGEHEAADKAVRDLLALTPETSVTREQLDKWYQPELVEKLIEGLRKAGLQIDEHAAPAPSRPSSTEIRSNEGFWIAVLPFKSGSSNPEIATLADGLSEEIVTGLSRFSYLRVVARSSTLHFSSESTDVRVIGKQIGARYVIEGSLRQSGMKLRLAVQLVDTTTGAHLWAETYDRSFNSEDVFSLQDDLAPRVVSTVADQYGALVHSMSESLRGRSAGQYSPHEAVLRAFGYWERMTPEEHAEVRDILEAAVAVAPDHSDCLAALASIYWHEYAFGYNLKPDPVGRARAAAQRAVASAPTSHFAHCALATSLFFQKDYLAFLPAAERTLALNRMDSSTAAILGNMIAYSGDWEYGLGIVERAMQLNPNHAGWYHYVTFCDSFRKHDYSGALASILKVNMPAYHWPHVYRAAVYGQLGDQQRARAALREVHALVPNFGTSAREDFIKWLDPELTEHLLDGLRKAGLEIADEDRPADALSVLHSSGEKRVDEGFWIAVLPFKATVMNAELSTLAEGLSDEIVTGLNRFSYLRVIARSSTHQYSSQTSDVRSVGKGLGARYVMEGNVRQAGSVIRVTVQLIDANTGAHLWAETYDRPFKPDEIFALQDDLVPRIVSTVADQHGVLPHSMSEVVRAQDPDQLTAYETLLRGFRYYEGVTASEHATIRASLERALETSPGSADCWAMLSIMYCDEHKFGFNQLPDSLGRALNAAQRAVEISPTNPFAYEALSQALFFRKEFDSFRKAAERAIALNPMDGATNAFMGILIAFTGDWDYGCAVAERATQLNPHHPGWYWNAAFYNAYRQRDYESALRITLEFNMPGLFYHHVNRAAVYGQLDDREAASKALDDLLALKPDFDLAARGELGKWLRPELVDHVIEGLRKAGLVISEAETSITTSGVLSSMSRADEGFWIAVLPFKFTGSNTEVATLAEGLSEEIVTGLSRFSYLRVISRSSTLRYANETDDVRAVGKTLGARYVMEGSLRIAGSSLRVSVQLIDANSGAHLWAETYDRQFLAEEVFALQDDLVPRIVSTVADVNGVLPRSMSEAVCSKYPGELSPYEAVLRSFRYFDRVTPEELAAARSCLEVAVEKAPTNSDAWAMLALLFGQDYGQGFNLHPDALNSCAIAAQRAVEAGPSNHLAYFSLAQARFFQKDSLSFRNAVERAVALNPMDANSVAFMGELLTYIGEWERGLALAARAKEISPNHPGWFWYADFFYAYHQRDYERALNLIVKANLPGHWGMHAGIASAAAQVGDNELASKAVRDLLKLRPDFVTTVNNEYRKWFSTELREHLIEGLRKAGLGIHEEKEQLRTQRGPEEEWQVAPEGHGAPDVTDVKPALEQTTALNSDRLPVNDKLKFTGHSPSIAVLPFLNISNDPNNEYFCDGLAEELLNALSKIGSLRVAARTSAFSFKGKQVDIREIASRLNVSIVLEGSVRRSADRVRIVVQLINVADGYQIWSQRYDREVKDIFDVQDDISLAVVEALKLELFGHEKAALLKRYTEDAEVHELFLKGRYQHYKYTAEGWNRAIELFERAIEKQPDYAPAYAAAASSRGCLWFFGLLPAEQTIPQCKSAALKALEIDKNLADAYLSLAIISFFYNWDWKKAEREFNQSIALNPNNAEALSYYAMFLGFEERLEEAISWDRRALEIDPLSPLINMNVGWTYFSAGRLDEALDQATKMIEIEPDFFGAYWLRGVIHLSEGEYETAIDDLKTAVLQGGRQIVLADLGSTYALADKNEEAKAILHQLLEMRRQEYVPAICLARVYCRLGENDTAIEWLEKAFEEKNGEMVLLGGEIAGAAEGDSLKRLGNDPRVQDLLRKMNLPK